MKTLTAVAVGMMILAIGIPLVAQEKGGVDVTGPYDWVQGWLKPVEQGRRIHPVAIFAESEDRIFIGLNGTSPEPTPGEHRLETSFDSKLPGARADHQLIIVNRNGEKIEEWSQWYDLFGQLHKITMNPYDPEKHIWVIARGSGMVMEFTHDGKKLVFSLGEKGVPGNDDKHFGRPTGIAWFPDGTFFVSDGYANSRVVKFDKDGKYVKAWGTKGSGPGQFNVPHGIAVDAKRRVYVADQLNRRIQIFDENGKYLDEWDNFLVPQEIYITQDQYAWVSDAAAARFLKYDLNGKLLTYWGTDADPDRFMIGANLPWWNHLVPGGLGWPHGFSVDPQGNLYVVSGHISTVDKFVPKKDTDKSRLIGQMFR